MLVWGLVAAGIVLFFCAQRLSTFSGLSRTVATVSVTAITVPLEKKSPELQVAKSALLPGVKVGGGDFTIPRVSKFFFR